MAARKTWRSRVNWLSRPRPPPLVCDDGAHLNQIGAESQRLLLLRRCRAALRAADLMQCNDGDDGQQRLPVLHLMPGLLYLTMGISSELGCSLSRCSEKAKLK